MIKFFFEFDVTIFYLNKSNNIDSIRSFFMTSINNANSNKPDFFDLLKKEDKDKYWNLFNYISNLEKKCKRYRKAKWLVETFNLIRLFCVQNDADDWKRCLVCGIFWIDNDIVINTSQLKLLICRCKATINQTLSEMGYVSIQINEKYLSKLPFLKNDNNEHKKWNIRKRIKYT